MPLGGVLGVQAGLHGVAARPQRPPHRGGVALGEAEHPLHEVDAEDRFGDGVLDLEPGVHLEEGDLLALSVVEELDGARGAVAHVGAEPLGRFLVALAQMGRDVGRGGLLDHLLVAALEGAVAVPEDGDRAKAVAEDLRLDVPGAAHQPFEEQPGIAETALGQALDAAPGLAQLGRVRGGAHADAAAAPGRLEHHGVADAVGFGERVRRVVQQSGPGEQRDPGGFRGGPRGVLGAEQFQVLGGGTDEGDPGVLDGPRERRVLGEEPVPGVDRARPGRRGGLQDRLGPQVGVGGGRAADAHRLIGGVHVRGGPVGVGVDGDRLEPHALRGRDDAHGDLAAVGDQEGVEGQVRTPR